MTHNADEIEGRELIAYDIAPDGSRFRMRFKCQDGSDCAVSFPHDCLKSLMMTLPRIMAQAMRAKYRDDMLRLVYPADTIRLEQSSDPKTVILTFVTTDKFAVSFSLSKEQMSAISKAALLPEEATARTMPSFN
jgi:hypothetical protein